MNIYQETKNKILDAIYQNFKNLNEGIENKVTCEQPKNKKFGDISSNVILVVSKILKLDKKNISKILINTLLKNKYFDRAALLKINQNDNIFIGWFFKYTDELNMYSNKIYEVSLIDC